MECRIALLVGLLVLAVVAARPSDPPTSEVERFYNFHYNVFDSASGDVKSHSETRRGSELRGVYRFLQPDGCVRVVHYTADSMGFHPTVTYEGGCQFVPLEQAVSSSEDDLRKLILVPESVPVGSSVTGHRDEVSNEASDADAQVEPIGRPRLFDSSAVDEHRQVSGYQRSSTEAANSREMIRTSAAELHPISEFLSSQSVRQSAESQSDVPTSVQSVATPQTNEHNVQLSPTTESSHPSEPHSSAGQSSDLIGHPRNHQFSGQHIYVSKPIMGPTRTSDMSFDHSNNEESLWEAVEYFIPEPVIRMAIFNPDTPHTGRSLDHASQLESSEPSVVEFGSGHPLQSSRVLPTEVTSAGGHSNSDAQGEFDPTQIVVTEIEASSEDLLFESSSPSETEPEFLVLKNTANGESRDWPAAESEVPKPSGMVEPEHSEHGVSCASFLSGSESISDHPPLQPAIPEPPEATDSPQLDEPKASHQDPPTPKDPMNPATVSSEMESSKLLPDPEERNVPSPGGDRVAKTTRKPPAAGTESWKPASRLVPHSIRVINSHTNPAGWNSGRQVASEVIRRPEVDETPVTWKPPSLQAARNPQLTRQAANRYRALPTLESAFAGSYGMRIPGYVPHRLRQTVPEYVPLRPGDRSGGRKTQWSPIYKSA